jgi:hypothetical protein
VCDPIVPDSNSASGSQAPFNASDEKISARDVSLCRNAAFSNCGLVNSLVANFTSVSYSDFLSSPNIWFDVLMKSYAVVTTVIDKFALAGSRYF